MVLSFSCSKKNFLTSVKKYKEFKTLTIKKISNADFSNWDFYNNIFLYDEINHNNCFINIRLNDKILSDELHKQINENPQNLGFYISISEGKSIEIIDYGLLLPSKNNETWIIRLLKDDPRNIKFINNEMKFKLSPIYSTLSDFQNVLFNKPYSSSSPLIIDYSYEKLKKLASKDNGFNVNQLDIGLKNMKNDNSINLSFTNSPEKVLKSIDPIEFLTDKYFFLLYNNSAILEYFIKSSIPRMYLLSRDNTKLVKDSLSKLIIESLLKFDQRHEFGVQYDNIFKYDTFKNYWLSDEFLLDKMELNYRIDTLNNLNMPQNIGDSDLEKLNEFLDKFKLKDIKLQLILNLELLKLLKIENNENENNEKKISKEKNEMKKEKRTSLVSKRYSTPLVGKKKRLIPTLLGTIIPNTVDFDVDFRLNDNLQKNEKTLSQSTVESLINILFDKLCVYDAIMGLDYKDINSSWGFLSNCIIPFFEKDHKQLINTLVTKSRGPSFKLEPKSYSDKPPKTGKRNKLEKLKGSQKLKIIRKAATIDLSQIKLKRSHSSFSNSKADLSRKTFDMTKPTLFTTLSFESNNINNSVNNSVPIPIDSLDEKYLIDSPPHENGGFMSSRKRKLLAPKRVVPTKVQKINIQKELNMDKQRRNKIEEPKEIFHRNQVIEATPRKKPRQTAHLSSNDVSLIVKSPVSNITNPKNSFKQPDSPETFKTQNIETQIKQTPEMDRIQIKPGVFEIGSSPLKYNDIQKEDHNKLILQTPKRQQIVESSPIQQSVRSSYSLSTKRKLKFN